MNPELKIPEFKKRNYATVDDYPDEFGEPRFTGSGYRSGADPLGDVKVVDPVEAQQKRRMQEDILAHYGPIEDQLAALDDGARLDTPSARRQRTIDDMTADLEKAIERGEKAKAWAQSIGLSSTIVSKLNRGLDALSEALGEIGQFESRT